MRVSAFEQHLLLKMNSDDLKMLKLTKIWVIGFAIVLCTLISCITFYYSIDRLETGHAVVTTSTRSVQTVVYPDQKNENPEYTCDLSGGSSDSSRYNSPASSGFGGAGDAEHTKVNCVVWDGKIH